jgi:hypothetical protein
VIVSPQVPVEEEAGWEPTVDVPGERRNLFSN